MLRHRFASLAAVCGLGLALSGCLSGDNSPLGGADDPATDEEAIGVVTFEENAELTNPDVRFYEDESGAAAAPIATERWRRQLLSLDRSLNISIDRPDGGPATASVEMTGEAIGLLHLWGIDDSTEEPWRLAKDFDDTARRSLFFERSRISTARHRGWRLVAMSGVEIASAGTTREIRSVHVQSGDVDKAIDGVSELVRVEDLLTLSPGAEATVTVDTGDATDAVFLHVRHKRMRMEMTNNQDGTFSGTYIVGDRVGPRHVVIDVLSNGTLFDDEELYDNVAWGIPYRVGGRPNDGGGDLASAD